MSNNYNSVLQSNNIDLQTILTTINELPEAVEQATPTISVASNGLITATAGAKSSTYQLAFQAAKTITPTTTSQTAVSSGYYTGGNITVAGDSNLVAGNIKSGVSIFGVSGTYAGSGGDTSIEDGIISRLISGSYTNSTVTSIGTSAFASCYKLTNINFTKVKSISESAFYSCTGLITASFPEALIISQRAFSACYSLTTISFPKVTTICSGAFYTCQRLTDVNFPAAKSIWSSAFYGCVSLSSASFQAVSNISGYVFQSCFQLKSLYLGGSSVCKLAASNAFSSTPIGGYSTSAGTYGSIYVPTSLLASYKAATNWTYFSSRFVGI